MQIERLIQMIFYIVNHEHVTAKELANLFGVSTRTIYRDVNTLSLAGIPIISRKGTGGGITIMEGYSLSKSLLSNEEQQNIFQGLQILQASKYPNSEATLNKISSIFKSASESQWLEVDFSYWGSDESQKVSISELQYAIINKKLITFLYFNTELQKTTRMIEPLRLVFKSHTWYIIGYCRSREEIRVFRMSRMKEIKVLSEIFERELPQNYSLLTNRTSKLHSPPLKLKFFSEIAGRVYDEFHENEVLMDEEGNYIVTVYYELSNWTFNRLLSYGNYVEIIEPESARKMLRDRALKIAEIYQ